MSFNVLAIGDVHFKISNIQEVELFIEKIETLAKNKKPDLIVILGDVLDTHEKLHTVPLNKATEFFEKMRKIANTHILVGNHDMCFGKDTEFIKYNYQKSNGTYFIEKIPIKVQDIKVGDSIVGPDSLPRKVKSLTSGRNILFEIDCFSESFIVSYNHILSLYRHREYIPRKKIFRILGRNLRFIEKHIDDINMEERKRYFDDIMDRTNSVIDIPLSDYIILPKKIQRYLYAIKISKNNLISFSNIYYRSIGLGNYYGFKVNLDNRVLLKNGIVVHNCNNQQFLNSNHWMNSFKNWSNIEIVEKVEQLETPFGDILTFVPYVPPGRFIEALDTVENWRDSVIIFAHQEFRNCKMGCITSVEGDEWSKDLPMVISGHIHSRDRLQKNIYYTGSAMQHAFGESEKNTVAMIEIENGKYKIEEIDLELPRKRIEYLEIENVQEYLDTTEIENNDKIRLTLSGDFQEFKTFTKSKTYKELIKKGIKVKYNKNKVSLTEFNKGEIEKDIDFNKVLYEKVHSETNPYLTAVYERIFLGYNTTEKDILYI